MKLTAEEKEVLAQDNWRYIHHFAKKYHSAKWNYEELVSAGAHGMTEALNAFDTEKGVKFSTYSARCITNRIFMYMRKEKKHQGNISIDQPFATDETGKELTILDTLSNEESDDVDWREISPVVNKVLLGLTVRNQKILRLFLNNRTQREIGEELGLSQSFVSRIIKKILSKIKKEYWKGEEKMAAIKMEDYLPLAHLTAKEIAGELGVTPKDVSNFRFRNREKLLGLSTANLPDSAVKQPAKTKDTQEDKTAEYERLIAALRKDLTDAHTQADAKEEIIRDLKAKIEKFEHVDAACEDVEEEVAALREKNQQLNDSFNYHREIFKKELYEKNEYILDLQNKIEELENAPLPVLTPLQCDCEVKVHRLEEENAAMRQLLKLWM